MQIEIYNPPQGQPLPPIEWNYPEIKKWVEDGLAAYKGRVYTEETIAAAKKDRATLNKLAAAIDNRRKEMKALYLEPYAEFERQAKKLTALVNQQADEIAAQIKAYDDARREEKLNQIKALYAEQVGELAALVPYERLHNPKWLNVTTGMADIKAELGGKIDSIISGLTAIDKLALDPDITVQVERIFLRTFDLAAALAEVERILHEREELNRRRAVSLQQNKAQSTIAPADEDLPTEPKTCGTTQNNAYTAEEPIHTITFRIHVTPTKLRLLGDFMRANGIVPERV